MSANYRRQGPRALCQNYDDLLSITEFNFDLTDPFFIGYFVSRTGILMQLSKYAPGILSMPKDEDGHLIGHTISAQEWAECCESISNPHDATDRILRAKLQDCWYLYCEHNEQALILSDARCFAHKIACALIAEWGVDAVIFARNIIPFPAQQKPKHHADLPDVEPTNIISVDFDDDSDAIRCSPNYKIPSFK